MSNEQIIKQGGNDDDETEIEDQLEEVNLLKKSSSSKAFKCIQILQNQCAFDQDKINHNLKNFQTN